MIMLVFCCFSLCPHTATLPQKSERPAEDWGLSCLPVQAYIRIHIHRFRCFVGLVQLICVKMYVCIYYIYIYI